jgi:hypothetical protein
MLEEDGFSTHGGILFAEQSLEKLPNPHLAPTMLFREAFGDEKGAVSTP